VSAALADLHAEPAECPACRARMVAYAPMLFTGEMILVEAIDEAGDLVVTRVSGGWGVRRLAAGERVEAGRRRREHRCTEYAYPGSCGAVTAGDCSPECGQPARFYPCGWRCDRHQPTRPRAL
jgi:hypothetical protein